MWRLFCFLVCLGILNVTLIYCFKKFYHEEVLTTTPRRVVLVTSCPVTGTTTTSSPVSTTSTTSTLSANGVPGRIRFITRNIVTPPSSIPKPTLEPKPKRAPRTLGGIDSVQNRSEQGGEESEELFRVYYLTMYTTVFFRKGNAMQY